MLLLALDTATPALTAALHDGSRVLAAQTTVTTRKHGELLAAMIEQVLEAGGATRADLEAVAVGTGPGPYTGLRAGLVTARVLASALGIPAVGVCTLDVMARAAVPAAAGREFIVASDARRKEVYWARYSAAGQRIGDPQVGSVVALGGDDPSYNPPGAAPGGAARAAGHPLGPASGRPSRLAWLTPFSEVPVAGETPRSEVPVAGEGPVLYPELTACPIPPRYPDAAQLGEIAAERLAAGGPLEPAQPLYLRHPDARVPGKPKRVTPA